MYYPSLFAESPCPKCGHELRLIYSMANWREPLPGERPDTLAGVILTEPYLSPCVFCPGCGASAPEAEYHGNTDNPQITDLPRHDR